MAACQTPPRTAPTPCSDLAEQLAHTIKVSRALLETGRTVDLTGLLQSAGILCAKALDLAPRQGRLMRPALIALMAEVDAASAALQTCSPINPRQKAAPWSPPNIY